ncbi:hypothetical protein IP92_04944 [Pseudoduganella flava]|uniref:Uncharacterized protein n=1 Tax=Pseudoduganella flava TaxID=871742 RepID=A0A562PGK9_9BURK|nr:putative type VI secretion system effector [Pseudoduganella flava]QGZ40203.1 hypothetical protein GO485_14875 [Pseudoduganella flava]TWI43380.1 hypothetical protein IP92_04944 [Pseudoduganella flava]
MTEFINHPRGEGLVKISGVISHYRVSRDTASFFFTQSDQSKFGAIAVAASLAGLGGQAMATAANATSLEEEADFVQFRIDGVELKGWLWRSPFKEGDIVDVAAEWRDDHYEVFGVVRPADRTIALYPHCTRGRRTHVKNAIKWWIYVSVFFDVGIVALSGVMSTPIIEYWTGAFEDGGGWVIGGIHVVIAIAVYSMTKQWMPFVRVAEKVFQTLGLPNPAGVDLVKSSKGKHKPDDSFEYGAMFFRY